MEQARLAFFDRLFPFTSTAKGEAVGIAIEIVRASFASEGISCTFVPVRLGDGEKAMREQRVDGVVAYGATSERAKHFLLSPPYIPTGACLFLEPCFVGSNEPRRPGYRLATPEGGPLFAQLGTRFPAARVLPSRDYMDSLEMVMRGEADAAALNVHTAAWLVREYFPGKLAYSTEFAWPLPMSLAVAGGKAAMLERFNQGLTSLKAAGEYDLLLRTLEPRMFDLP